MLVPCVLWAAFSTSGADPGPRSGLLTCSGLMEGGVPSRTALRGRRPIGGPAFAKCLGG